MTNSGENHRSLVAETIYKATIALDDQKWDAWLDLCDEKFNYAIKSFSPEINREMTYLEHDRQGLKVLMDLLPKHNTDHSPLRRHTSVYVVEMSPDQSEANAVSSFVVYQNMLDGENSHIDAGESRLFLIGKYYDKFKIEHGEARFMERIVRLDNRRLDKGSHWPI
jgi:methanesulfonate monooxygenase small subunit